jgi:hypothetical protein
MSGVAPGGAPVDASWGAVGGAAGTERWGAGAVGRALFLGSTNGAPQNLQYCADASLLPLQRAQTRAASGATEPLGPPAGSAGGLGGTAAGSGAGPRRLTIGVGAMGSLDGAGGGEGGCGAGGAEGTATGTVRSLAAAGSTELPQETQNRVPGSLAAPHLGQRTWPPVGARGLGKPPGVPGGVPWGPSEARNAGGSMRVGGRSASFAGSGGGAERPPGFGWGTAGVAGAR